MNERRSEVFAGNFAAKVWCAMLSMRAPRMAATLRDEAEGYRRETLQRARDEVTRILDDAAGRTPA